MVAQDWKIQPFLGLGSLKFGMSMDEVGNYNQLYGEVDSVFDDKATTEYSIQMLKENQAIIPNSEELIKDLNETLGDVFEVRRKSDIKLTYRNKKLIGITVGQRNKEINIDDIIIFSENQRGVVSKISNIYGKEKILGSDILFENGGFILIGFASKDRNAEKFINIMTKEEIRKLSRESLDYGP